MRHLWPLTLLLCACMGTEVGNPQTEVVVDVRPDVPGTRTQALSGADGITITSVELSVARIALRAGDNCSVRGEDPLLEDATWTIVAGAEATPERFTFVSPTGTYCQLRVELGGDGPSFRLRGTFPDGASFLIEETRPLKFVFSGKNQELALERLRERFALVWDVATWVRAEDFSHDDDDEDDEDDGLSERGRGEILRRVRASVRLARDLDADDTFSAREFEAYEVTSDP